MDSYSCYGHVSSSAPVYVIPGSGDACSSMAYPTVNCSTIALPTVTCSTMACPSITCPPATTTTPSYPGQAPSYYLQTFLVPSPDAMSTACHVYTPPTPCPPPVTYSLLPQESSIATIDIYHPPPPGFPAIFSSLGSQGDLSEESVEVIRVRSEYIDEYGKKHSTEMATLMAMAAEEREIVNQLEAAIKEKQPEVDQMEEKVKQIRKKFEDMEIMMKEEEASIARIAKKVRNRQMDVTTAEDELTAMMNAKKQYGQHGWTEYGRLQKELDSRRKQLADERRQYQEAQENLNEMDKERQKEEQTLESQASYIEQLRKQNQLLHNLRHGVKQVNAE